MRASSKLIQPFFVANTNKYYKMIEGCSPVIHYYRFCACLKRAQPVIAVPDGCVDVLFSLGRHEVTGRVYGSVTQHLWLDGIQDKEEYFGVRFYPGMLPRRLDIAIPELINACVSICDFKGGRELMERISSADSFLEMVQLLRVFIAGTWRVHETLDRIIKEALARRGEKRVTNCFNKSNQI